jgi:AcrR family transcriptional regulator
MVNTPWGSSDALRERRLPPGPGRSPQEVARNQRERLFGAMVTSVVRRGLAATRLTDLTELSGVSSKSFYELFPDKDACFLATMEALLATVPEDAGPVALAEWIAAQPAAATVCLVEAHAGAPEVRERLEATIAGVEARARQAATAREPDLPPEMVTAYVGAMLEIARLRLRRGTEAELPALFEQLDPLLIDAYPPPPEPLRLTTRRHPRGEETLDATDHAERILQALILVAAEEGYVRTTIDQIVKRAGISASMFYNHFQSKEEALLAAIDSAGARLVAAVLPAFRRSAEWPHAVRVGMGALFNQLGARPALAQLLLVEAPAAGPEALERREEALRPLEALMVPARRRAPQTPAILFEAIPGGINHLAYKRLREGGAAALPGLAPVAAYLVLAPFLGGEEAGKVANAEPRPSAARVHDPEAVREAALTRVRHGALLVLANHEATVGEIAAAVESPEEVVQHHLDALERAELIQRVEGEDRVLYRSQMGELTNDEFGRLSRAEREKLSALVVELIRADLDRSLESGTFDDRSERVMVRAPLVVDEKGYLELSDLHTRAMAAGFEIEAKAKARMEESGEKPIEVRHILVMFEVPPLSDDEA